MIAIPNTPIIPDMMNESAILIVDNNEDEMILIQEAVIAIKLEKPVHFFSGSEELFKFLHETKQAPFIIISDINLKKENAFALKKQISTSPTLIYKTIPFVYWSAISVEKLIQSAYDVHSQGFFFKPFCFDELCDTLVVIVKYWQKSKHPMPLR